MNIKINWRCTDKGSYIQKIARQVYNLFQDLWNKFLGFIQKVLSVKMCSTNVQHLSFIRCSTFGTAKPVTKPLETE